MKKKKIDGLKRGDCRIRYEGHTLVEEFYNRTVYNYPSGKTYTAYKPYAMKHGRGYYKRNKPKRY